MSRLSNGLVCVAFSLSAGPVMLLARAQPAVPADSTKGAVIGTGTFTAGAAIATPGEKPISLSDGGRAIRFGQVHAAAQRPGQG